MGVTGTIITSVLAGVVATIVCSEFAQWRPAIVRKLVSWALRRLPEGDRERYREEWTAYTDEIPGDLSKVFAAAGFLIAARRMTSKVPLAMRALAIVLVILVLPSHAILAALLMGGGHKVFQWKTVGGEPTLKFSTPQTPLGRFLWRSSMDQTAQIYLVALGRAKMPPLRV